LCCRRWRAQPYGYRGDETRYLDDMHLCESGAWTSCDNTRYSASVGSKHTTKNTNDELDGKCLENVGQLTYHQTLPVRVRSCRLYYAVICPVMLSIFSPRRALSPGWASDSAHGPAIDCFLAVYRLERLLSALAQTTILKTTKRSLHSTDFLGVVERWA
jgi:hypothetical protein